MMVRFEGFEHGFEVLPESPLVVEVENRRLYARVCQALLLERGRESSEPYSLWRDDDELKPGGMFMSLTDPFRLPWDDPKLLAAVYERVEKYCWEDEEVRCAVEKADVFLRTRCAEIGLQMHADYSFGVEWDMRRYLKTSGFSPEHDADDSLIDNMLRFVSFVADACPSKPLLLVNFKTFFSKHEVEMLYERSFFLKIPLLLLENRRESVQYKSERKINIDQDFLER